MKLTSKILVSIRYFQENWFKSVLASGGIFVGVFCITLTTFISLGLSNKIVTAINSQAGAKYIEIQKVDTGATSIFEVTKAPKFVQITSQEIQSIAKNNPAIVEVAAQNSFVSLLKVSPEGESCWSQNQPLKNIIKPSNSENCYSINIDTGSFQNYYQSNKANWIGQTTSVAGNEVIACYQCLQNDPIYKRLKLNSPEELLGKTLELEYFSIPNTSKPGDIYDVTNPPKNTIYYPEQSIKFNVNIVAVIDDSDSESALNSNKNFFGSSDLAQKASEVNPNSDYLNGGLQTIEVFVDDYNSLEKVIKKYQNAGYLTTSNAQILIKAISSLFTLISIVLGIFGFIALIASVFGIVNVMLISTIRRSKEIGILKSLGAKNKDIFQIFILEGSILGMLGWFLGTVGGYLIGQFGSYLFTELLLNNPTYRDNLANFGITDFNLVFDYRILFITLITVLIITTLSSLAPASIAAKKNPVSILNN